MKCNTASDRFLQWSQKISWCTGRPLAVVFAVALLVGWGLTGPVFDFSDSWQLVMNSGTTAVTFLMVFIIQASQNHDTAAIHLKLDELLRATKDARNQIIDLEEQSEENLVELRQEYRELAEIARDEATSGKPAASATSRAA
jgi:low affinity Fe/Cu permease